MASHLLSEFNIHAERGFLPYPDPLLSLPDKLRFLDEYAIELPRLIRGGRTKTALAKLKPLTGSHYELMGDKHVRQRVFMIYSFLASACVFPKGEAPTYEIPEGVAIPLYTLAWWLDVPPILAYQSYALYNWKRKDPNGPIITENLENLVNFADLPDEPGFILPHVEIDAKATPAIRSAIPLVYAANNRAAELCEAFLWEIGQALQAIILTLAKIRKYCDPAVYYKDVRPYIQKFVNVVYHGVSKFKGEPQSFHGESGAQDSNLPLLDALLEIEHRAPDGNKELKQFLAFLEAAELSMPSGHRKFISLIRAHSGVRQFVIGSTSGVKEAYNFCVEQIAEFRHQHLGLAIDYIHKPMPQETLGTFGTPFMKWLNWIRESTLTHRIL